VTLPPPLLKAAKERRLIPFIGAGFSLVFKDLPTWSKLMDRVASHTGFDPEIALLYGDFLQLAEYLAIKPNGLSTLRSELDKVFNSSTIDVSTSKAHLLLAQLKARTIYTTNWDDLIERSFKYVGENYDKIVTVDDFLHANPYFTALVKFHGDFSSGDNSLVFTESSYFERLSFESPLDIRLRADMLGNTLLFIGYSFSDFNIRYMWFKLQKLLAEQQSAKPRDPFAYIVMAQRNPIFEEICKCRNIGVLFLDAIDPQLSLISLLQKLVDQVVTSP
jgi:hypothetical protein